MCPSRGTDTLGALGDAPEDYVQRQLRGIVGFSLAITRLEGKWKVSRNRPPADREGVVSGLSERCHQDDRAMSGLVETMDQE